LLFLWGADAPKKGKEAGEQKSGQRESGRGARAQWGKSGREGTTPQTATRGGGGRERGERRAERARAGRSGESPGAEWQRDKQQREGEATDSEENGVESGRNAKWSGGPNRTAKEASSAMRARTRAKQKLRKATPKRADTSHSFCVNGRPRRNSRGGIVYGRLRERPRNRREFQRLEAATSAAPGARGCGRDRAVQLPESC
jgi:hypothetical protein